MGMITDIGTIITTGPSAASVAKSSAAAGPIMDLPGMLQSVKLDLQELKTKLTEIDKGLDSGDGIKTSLTTLNNLI